MVDSWRPSTPSLSRISPFVDKWPAAGVDILVQAFLLELGDQAREVRDLLVERLGNLVMKLPIFVGKKNILSGC